MKPVPFWIPSFLPLNSPTMLSVMQALWISLSGAGLVASEFFLPYSNQAKQSFSSFYCCIVGVLLVCFSGSMVFPSKTEQYRNPILVAFAAIWFSVVITMKFGDYVGSVVLSMVVFVFFRYLSNRSFETRKRSEKLAESCFSLFLFTAIGGIAGGISWILSSNIIFNLVDGAVAGTITLGALSGIMQGVILNRFCIWDNLTKGGISLITKRVVKYSPLFVLANSFIGMFFISSNLTIYSAIVGGVGGIIYCFLIGLSPLLIGVFFLFTDRKKTPVFIVFAFTANVMLGLLTGYLLNMIGLSDRAHLWKAMLIEALGSTFILAGFIASVVIANGVYYSNKRYSITRGWNI